MTVSPDSTTGASFGPNPLPATAWDGVLTNPTGINAWLKAEFFVESSNTYSDPDGGYGMLSWSSWATQAGYSNYASAPVSSVPGPIQDAVATFFGKQYFQMYGNWASVACSWYAGVNFLQLSQSQQIADAATDAAANDGQTPLTYVQKVLTQMYSYIGQSAPGGSTPTPTLSPTVSQLTQANNGTGGTLISSAVPANNYTLVKPGFVWNLNRVTIQGLPLNLTKIGDKTLLALVSDCTIDMSVNELASVVFTFQQGDAVLAMLNLGIGAPLAPVEVNFCNEEWDIVWPLVISTCQETPNAAQQPAVQITCTSKLQLWQGRYPPVGGPTGYSPTSWLYMYAKAVMGSTEYQDGRWVFAGQETKTGDPNFIVNAQDPATGQLQSSVYDVATAVQQSQSFYLFDSLGTTWFGEPSWITTKTQTVLIQYVPAGQTPLDGTGAIPIISPVGPPQVSETIQTVPSGFGMIQTRQIVRTVTIALPQYMAAQIGPGFHVLLAGTGPQYDSNGTDPWFAATGTAPASSTFSTALGPQWPYIVTEVTGTVDGGLSTWNVTFQEAVLPSQPQTPQNVVNPPAEAAAAANFSYVNRVNVKTGATLPTQMSSTTSGAKTASAFISYARSVIGAAYVYGAGRTLGNLGSTYTDISTTFDCSGLVYYALYRCGLGDSIPADSFSQAAWCTPITVTTAFNTPGALLFMYNPDDSTGSNQWNHVAISLGNGNMIEAPYTGTVVQTVPIQLLNGGTAIGDAGGATVDGNLTFTAGGLVPGLTYDLGVGYGANGAQAPANSSPDNTTPAAVTPQGVQLTSFTTTNDVSAAI